MNNACPSCGAVYNVAAKDIGRRIKCKRCSSALVVSAAGLEFDDPAGGSVPVADAGGSESFAVDDAPAPVSRRRPRRSGSGLDLAQAFSDLGGVPAALFGIGAFLVIVFLFQPLIGVAKIAKRDAAVLELDTKARLAKQRIDDDKDMKESDKNDRIKKLTEQLEKDKKEATEEKELAGYSNAKSAPFERYGMMFGFILLMFGSLGFLAPGQTPVRRTVGAIVLASQMVLVFFVFLIRAQFEK